MTRIDESEFFFEQKIHSKIKLKIFEDVLNCSIGIADKCSKNSNSKKYCYVDLFAGRGDYENEDKKGSPLIALDLIKNQLTQEKNNFSCFSLFLREKDSQNFAELEKNINENLPAEYKDRIRIDMKNCSWEDSREN